jgi:pimeloyl-ACP methyl ester carboxylesterase
MCNDLTVHDKVFCGQPPQPDYNSTIEIESIANIFHDLKITAPIHLFAHSGGGLFAFEFASKYPELVKSLLLIEPGLHWLLDPNNDPNNYIKEFFEITIRSGIAMTYDDLKEYTYSRGIIPRDIPVQRLAAWDDLCAFKAFFDYRNLLWKNSTMTVESANMDKMKFPVLLIRGSESEGFYPMIIERLLHLMPNCKVVDIPGKHSPHVGIGKKQFLKVAKQFYSEVDKQYKCTDATSESLKRAS